MTRLLILGAQGQIGWHLPHGRGARSIPHAALRRAECDITNHVAVERVVRAGSIVINCAAYTSVDRAETEVALGYRVNTFGTQNLATICGTAGIPLVHLSTDHVFDGQSDRPARDDPPRPLNVYGRTKLDDEVAVRMHLRSHIIQQTN